MSSSSMSSLDLGASVADVLLVEEEDENEKLQRRLLALQTVRNDFQRKDQSIAALKKRILFLENEKLLLEQKCADTDTLNARILQLERVVADRNGLLQEIQNLNAEIIRMKDENARLEMVIVDLRLTESKHARRMQQKDENIAQKEEIIKSMSQDHASQVEISSAEIAALKELVHRLKNDVVAKDKKIISMQTITSSLEEKVEKLKNVIKESKDQRQQAQGQAAEYLTEVSRWKSLCGEVESNLKLSRTESASVMEEHGKMTSSLQSQLKQMISSEKKTRRAYQNLSNNVSSLASDIHSIATFGVHSHPSLRTDESAPALNAHHINSLATDSSYHLYLRSVAQALRSHWTQQSTPQQPSAAVSPAHDHIKISHRDSDIFAVPTSPSRSSSKHNVNESESSELRTIIAGIIRLIECYLDGADKIHKLTHNLDQSSTVIENAVSEQETLEARHKQAQRDVDIYDEAMRQLSMSVHSYLSAHVHTKVISQHHDDEGKHADTSSILEFSRRQAHSEADEKSGHGLDDGLLQRMWESITQTAILTNTSVDATNNGGGQESKHDHNHKLHPEVEKERDRQQCILRTTQGIFSLIEHCKRLQAQVEELSRNESEAASRRRVIDQMTAQKTVELEERLNEQTVIYERIDKEREEQYQHQLAELSRCVMKTILAKQLSIADWFVLFVD
jgi:hypothetical protein